MTYDEIREGATRLYTAVIAQAVQDIVSEDPLERRSAKEFFAQKQGMPTKATQSFFNTTRNYLHRYGEDPSLLERIKTFKKLANTSVREEK